MKPKFPLHEIFDSSINEIFRIYVMQENFIYLLENSRTVRMKAFSRKS